MSLRSVSFLATVLALTLAACGGGDDAPDEVRVTLRPLLTDSSLDPATVRDQVAAVAEARAEAYSGGDAAAEIVGDAIQVTIPDVSQETAESLLAPRGVLDFRRPLIVDGYIRCKAADGSEFLVPPTLVNPDPVSGQLARCFTASTLHAELLGAEGLSVRVRTTDVDVTPRSDLLLPWAMRESIKGEEPGLLKAALGELELRRGRRARARSLFAKAVDENPKLSTARLFLARLLLDDGEAGRAIDVLESLRTAGPASMDVLTVLGDAYYQQRNFAQAAELFESALAAGRPDASLFNALGTVHAQLGNREKAIGYLRQSLAVDPKQESVRTLLEKLEKSTR